MGTEFEIKDKILRTVESKDYVCEFFVRGGKYEKLLVAAPELLEALKLSLLALEPLVKQTPEGWDKETCNTLYKAAKAAIKKATS
jgi:hypothetical protein